MPHIEANINPKKLPPKFFGGVIHNEICIVSKAVHLKLCQSEIHDDPLWLLISFNL